MSANLLVELFVEELPPKALKMLGAEFSRLIVEGLRTQGLTDSQSATSFATPRRLATHILAVRAKAADKAVEQKLMPTNVGLDTAGNPTPALLKRLSALGLDAGVVPNLRRAVDGKAENLFVSTTVRGATLAHGLQIALNDLLAKLPIPKVMSYQLRDGWSSVNFVRPAHWLVALHGDDVVPVSMLGLTAGRTTRGHRFEALKQEIEIKHADTYAAQLREEGAVIAGFEERRAEIVRQLQAAAAAAHLQPIEDEALLDEVTALVERPNVLTCRFEEEYLEVPQECLILTMKANQKYFPLLDAGKKLSNKFLVVSNIRPADASRIVEGNERVVRPRLADAKFFFDQDRKKALGSHFDGLSRVVYHNKLGSQADRVRRIEAIALQVLRQLGVGDEALVREAALLCKCDLLTNMVGEFPELQGIMGRYYALAENKNAEIADAIREHYLPRGAGDALPATRTGIAVAIADKLDTIAGVFAVDQKPTGAKDPFAVRRAALGIQRIILERELSLDLTALIEYAVQRQPVGAKPDTVNEIYDYVMERLRGYYLEGDVKSDFTTEMFDAVLANRPAAPLDFDKRLRALHAFLKLPDAQSLAAANKRISNILRKSGRESFVQVDAGILQEAAEKALHGQVVQMAKETEPLFVQRDYATALARLAALRASVDAFFDNVMVMAEDEKLRNNRLALLAHVRGLFLRVADLSRLPG